MSFFKIIAENIHNYGILTFCKILFFELINIIYSIKNKDLQVQETDITSYKNSKIKSEYNTAYLPTPYYFLYIAKKSLKKLNIDTFNLIDLGCGFSRPALYFNKHFKIQYTGIDININTLTQIKKKNFNLININLRDENKTNTIIHDFFSKDTNHNIFFLSDPFDLNLIKKIFLDTQTKFSFLAILVNIDLDNDFFKNQRIVISHNFNKRNISVVRFNSN